MNLTTKAPGEVLTVSIDFAAALASGVTLSTLAVACETRIGADRDGILAEGESLSGTAALIPVAGGARGCVYDITATVTTSAGDTLAATATMAVA